MQEGSGEDRAVSVSPLEPASSSANPFETNQHPLDVNDSRSKAQPAKKKTVKTDVHAEQDAIAFAAKR
eukprot:7025530-Pyramimonas_sp.AAC.1